MFVYGGEFSNPNATQFHHYRDLWHLDLEDNEWEKVDAKGRGPTARSGHRMQVHGDRIFLFGGFSDFVKESKYLLRNVNAPQETSAIRSSRSIGS